MAPSPFTGDSGIDLGDGADAETEEALIGRYVSVLLHGEADAAGRAARIQSTLQVTDQDWRALALHVSARAAPGRAASRLFTRLRWLPFSHHHRFPLYEKVCHAAWRSHPTCAQQRGRGGGREGEREREKQRDRDIQERRDRER